LREVDTSVSETTLKAIADKFSEIPTNHLEVNLNLKRILESRAKLIANRTADWAIGEAFAFGSLLIEGTHVRLSGQDVERGTFSHRHHVLHDQAKDNNRYVPLNDLSPNQARYTVVNSSLSEYAVLGFEHGYSLVNPNSLVIWEAQFGDFANTAQPIIDQFIASGQAKWRRQSGLVMLLPHGYEGMGPEHSSARLERFLQLSDDDPDTIPSVDDEQMHMKQLQDINLIVAYPTTPANLMHMLRRQVKLPFRKPLVVMTPKALLRLPAAQSSFDEMLPGTNFVRAYKETGVASHNPENVKKIIFCSGKVYYDLVKERETRKLNDRIAICRIEQVFVCYFYLFSFFFFQYFVFFFKLSPFPYDLVKEELVKYSTAKVAFTQEEHKNAGAFEYVFIRLQNLLTRLKDRRAIDIR
jgi:2-oxoglutarate dehydrogenase E1 component